ncbi:MAG: RNA polymerase sigma factor [Dehalococcoidia bacterium]
MLIERARQGDLDAFDELVLRYNTLTFRCAYLILRDEDDAAEAVQEGFVRAYRELKSLRAPDKFGPWLLRIIKNEALRSVRVRERRQKEAQKVLAAPVSNPLTPANGVVAKEIQMDLWNALSLLGPDDRAVVTTRYYLGLNEEEMATVLECPRGTVKSRLHNALKRLRSVIERDFPELVPGPVKREVV